MTTRFRDLRNTPLACLRDDDIVYAHLSVGHVWTADHLVHSSLDLADQEMRQGRAMRTVSQYGPVLCAFALLNQIGECYRDHRLARHPDKGSPIARALYFFGEQEPLGPTVQALVALRNGLVHEASLTSAIAEQPVIFRYNRSQPELVRQPARPWDGAAGTLGPETTMTVNPLLLTELVSDAIERVRECFFERRQQLRVRLPGREILHRYCFWGGLGVPDPMK